MVSKIVGSFSSIAFEIREAFFRTKDWRSFFRFSADVLLIRLRALLPKSLLNRRRKIFMQDGTVIHYRFNTGDIWSVREICLCDAYRLPFEKPIRTIVDLGANIGLCSVWLAKQHQADYVLSVEPVPENCEVVEANLTDNQIPGTLVRAAIGPNDGTVRFEENAASNFGRVGETGSLEVKMNSMATVLTQLPDGVSSIDLLKMDIEGGEQELLCEGDLSWLNQVQSIIAEFHPEVVDYPKLIALLENQGFRYIPADSMFPEQMDCFVREGVVGSN